MLKNKKAIMGLIVSALFLMLILYNVDFKALIETIKSFQLSNLLLILGMYTFSLLLRAIRWWFLLQKDKKFNLYQLVSTWVIGSLMNSFLPARAGDIWRAYKVGNSSQESKMKLFGSVMLERILDGVSICTILYFCVLTYSNQIWLRNVANLSMLLFGGSFVIFYLIVGFKKIKAINEFFVKSLAKFSFKAKGVVVSLVEKICQYFMLFVSGFEVFQTGGCLLCASGLSFLIWLLEILIAYLVIASFGVAYPFSASMFVICFIALGSMIPSSSIFVGPYQYAYILALGLYFIPKSEALAIAFVHQTILMGVLLVFSLLFVLINFIHSMCVYRNVQCEENQENSPQKVL